MAKTLGWALCTVALLIAISYCAGIGFSGSLPVVNFWSIIGTISFSIGTYLTFKK